MQPDISVIVPIYGVEKYIERCARSLFEQSLDNIEYIFIDDCSPDKSIEILKRVLLEYPHRQSMARIDSMPVNSGQATVRNFGISQAKGKYIIHCDSDDWIDKEMYRSMYEAAIDNDADVVACDYYEADGVSNKLMKAFPRSVAPVNNSLRNWNCAGQLWNKLIKAEIYHSDIILPKDNMGEDMALVYQMAYYCKKIIYVKNPYYYFYQNPTSITHLHSDNKVFLHFTQTCNNVKLVEDFYLSHPCSPDTLSMLKRIKYQERNKILRIIRHDQKYYDAWKNTFPELGLNLLYDREFTIKEKIKYLLVKIKLYPFNSKND